MSEMLYHPTPKNVYGQATRVLRCCKTNRYFTGEGWSDNPAQAKPFSDEMDAVRACAANNLHDVELVLRNGEPGTELFSTQVC